MNQAAGGPDTAHAPVTVAAGSDAAATCGCGMQVSRSLVQCPSCGNLLWLSDPAPPPMTAPADLPLTAPGLIDTGFVEVQRAYDRRLREAPAPLMDLRGADIDARWKDVVDAVLALHFWDPGAFVVEILRVAVLTAKVSDWADRGGGVPTEASGWSRILSVVERLESQPSPVNRDWRNADIGIQHADAIPVRFDAEASVRRIISMTGLGQVAMGTVADLLIAEYQDFLIGFSRRHRHELEIVAADTLSAISARDDRKPDWPFIWPTYHGLLGVVAYNQWVERTAIVEWSLAKSLLDAVTRTGEIPATIHRAPADASAMAAPMQLSEVLHEVRMAADRMTAAGWPLRVTGYRSEVRTRVRHGTHSDEHRGDERHRVVYTATVPVYAPWQVRLARPVVNSETGDRYADVAIGPAGDMHVVRTTTGSPNLEIVSSNPLDVIRFVQRCGASAEWRPTGNAGDRAAVYPLVMTADEAARRLTARLRSL